MNLIHYQNPFPKKTLGPEDFTEFYKTLKEEIKPSLHKIFQKIEGEILLIQNAMRPVLSCYQNQTRTSHRTLHYITRKL